MRQDTNDKALRLILMLADTEDRTVDDMCKELDVSRRTLYYILETLRNLDFIIYKRGPYYHIDHRSPFITKLTDEVQFDDTELRTIWNLLAMMGDGNETITSLRKKLDSAYDFTRRTDTPEVRRLSGMVRRLNSAIERKKMVRIIGYSSPHSHTVADRIVEPYLLMNDSRDVRCHELSSGVNKTFRIARMKDVEVLDASWLHEKEHRQIFTDIFMFSGEEHHNVKLRVGQLTHNIFLEEYPHGTRYIRPDGDNPNHWIIDLEVCDNRGIGRFVLGLFEDIEILADDDFKEYIRTHIKAMTARMAE